MTNRIGPLALTLSLLLVAAMVSASSAFGYAHINSFSMSPSTTQAGGHPNVDISQTFDNRVVNEGGAPESENPACECQDPFEIKNEFPTGFIGNTSAVPRCTLLSFSQTSCPPDSQVGMASVLFGQQPLYNMEPHPGEPGLLGFFAPLINAPVFIELAGRTDSDYGLNGRTTGIFHLLPLSGVKLHLWGVPGDPVHAPSRWQPPETGLCFPQYPEPCPGKPPTPFTGTVLPFLENPTSCEEPLSAGLNLLYYDFTELHATTAWPATTGCDQLSFNPSLTAKPTTTQADTATGLDVDLSVPQPQSSGTPSPSEIKATKVTLPEGFSINPNAADGKTDCTDAQASFGTLNAAHCPEFSKVGTAEIDSSALPGPIDGGIYLGEPQPGNRYRLIVTGDGFSTHVKLAGSAHADPQTGQLTVSFLNLPQSPLQDFKLHFFGSERGLLATPSKCGTYPVETEFVPWDSVLPNQTSTAYFSVDQGPFGGTLPSGPDGAPCPGSTRPFAPTVGAGSRDTTAGAHSPFAFKLDRADGDQNLSGLKVTTPPGFSATLAGIPYCPDAAITKLSSPGYSGLGEESSPACPSQSQIGTAVAGVGAGTHPFYAPGRVYLAGPYKGGQLSLLVSIPAVSGPYDLGDIAVRAALEVNPLTAQVTAVSDALPQIIEGIPLRLRSILVSLDRSGFALNPTNCSAGLSVQSQVLGSEGGVANLDYPFQVSNCAVLPYSPKLSLHLSGGLNRLGHPAIHAALTAKPGEANTRMVSVALPPGEQLDNSHLGSVCTRVDFAKDSCPPDSLIGNVEIDTPILEQPLKGFVYLRSSEQGLPDLALKLEGQVDIEAVAKVDSVNGGLRASFKTVPDVPFSSINLNLAGGHKGLLQNSESLCGTHKQAALTMAGQNGALVRRHIPLLAACAKARHRRHSSHEARPNGKGA